MGKELQVSLGVIGVLLIIFLVVVYQRIVTNSSADPLIPTSVQNFDSAGSGRDHPQVNSQPTIVRDTPGTATENVQQQPQNPRKRHHDRREPQPIPDRTGRFVPMPGGGA